MLLVRSVISVLCAVGFYASVFMLRKSVLARRGMLAEPSVVQTPRATLFLGLPNALFGVVYYALVAAGSWLGARPLLWAALAAAFLAACTSAYLAYTLAFVTRTACPYCWTAHAANWALLAALACLTALR